MYYFLFLKDFLALIKVTKERGPDPIPENKKSRISITNVQDQSSCVKLLTTVYTCLNMYSKSRKIFIKNSIINKVIFPNINNSIPVVRNNPKCMIIKNLGVS